MIYTLTANPAIDYHMDLAETGLRQGEINRSAKEEMFPGGKGLNVSVILSELGMENIAWGFIAGKTGGVLEQLALEKGCRCEFIRLPEGETRINVKLDCQPETAINGTGPAIGEEQIAQLMERIGRLTKEDTLILSGNLHAGAVNLYEVICRAIEGRGVRLIVDTESRNLRCTFAYHPFLIKPNEEELLKLYDSTDRSTASLVSLMMRCQEEGVRNVLVTLGREGAMLLSENGGLYQAGIDNAKPAVSSVGAGDSTVAGFLAGLAQYGEDYEKALQLACAAGSATACRKWLAKRDEILAARDTVIVTKL